MPVPLRRFYGRKLIAAKEKEAESYKKASTDSTSEIARPTFQKS
jgi:hypothetical protein|tara:strand:- start:273 stop:404 length:132 start_codon:yes stop_codon:yes gene_type:complete